MVDFSVEKEFGGLLYQGVEGFFPLGNKAYHADEKVLICFSQQIIALMIKSLKRERNIYSFDRNCGIGT
jgi:hypothetical protein